MSLSIRAKDVITFGRCKVDAATVLDTSKTFKLCVRFDGAIEIVETDGDYCFTDVKFHWHPKEKFKVLDCDVGEWTESFEEEQYEEEPEKDEAERYYSYDGNGSFGYLAHPDNEIVFFIGLRSLLRKVKLEDREYLPAECDFIEAENQLPKTTTDKLELVMDNRSGVRIGYLIRKVDFRIQSYNAIEVHFHSDEGVYNQAVYYEANKNRVVMLGHQNGYAGEIGIPDMIYHNNCDEYDVDDTDVHGENYCREFIKSNLLNCDQAKEFYIPENPSMYVCTGCMKIAKEILNEMKYSNVV